MAEFSLFGRRNKPGPKKKAEPVVVFKGDESLEEKVSALREQGVSDQEVAAYVLGDGYTVAQAAQAADVTERTVYRWKHDVDFMQLVDTVTLTTGLANKAERIREAKRIVREVEAWRKQHDKVVSGKDILDWLKYIRDEQEGLRLFSDEQLEQFANAIIHAGSGGLADDDGRGQGGVDGEDRAEADGTDMEE